MSSSGHYLYVASVPLARSDEAEGPVSEGEALAVHDRTTVEVRAAFPVPHEGAPSRPPPDARSLLPTVPPPFDMARFALHKEETLGSLLPPSMAGPTSTPTIESYSEEDVPISVAL